MNGHAESFLNLTKKDKQQASQIALAREIPTLSLYRVIYKHSLTRCNCNQADLVIALLGS